jgi:hypothetical protein
MYQMERYLKATATIDCETSSVKEKAQSLTDGEEQIVEKAKHLFYFVRDEIKYNPYSALYPIQASATLERGSGFCVQKAVLLVALARSAKIPSRLGFVDIRNHILPEKLAKMLGTDLFVYHGYAELYIERKWVKATPTFDLAMCQGNRIIPVEFDGKNHAMFHSHNLDGKLHIEYVCQHGHYEDLPLNDMLDACIRVYGPKFLESWKAGFAEYVGR